MAVIKLAWSRNGSIYTGLSSDTKPTAGVGLMAGSVFIETDTGRMYTWDGTDWEAPWMQMLPPSSHFNIENMYVNAEGKLVVEYDDTPM